MRRRIRLTGRKQLSKSAVHVTLSELNGEPLVMMAGKDVAAFKLFPPDAKVTLRLVENKSVEIVDLGTIRKLSGSRNLSHRFIAPSCQLRIADSGSKARGLLLGSTDGWTLKGDDEDQPQGSAGILSFLAADTEPQSWKLELRENDYPLVLVDKRIPNAAAWAKNDPVFVATALPMIVFRIFSAILAGDHAEDVDWVAAWLKWADTIMPGREAPIESEDGDERSRYLDALIDSFCTRHELADKLLAATQVGDPQ